MTIWKPLSIENLNLAQRIFTSFGDDSTQIIEFSDMRRMDSNNIQSDSKRVYNEILNGFRESELIFDVKGSYRCRMYVYPENDLITQEKFPGSNYSLGITHMNHFSQSEKIVVDRFNRIEKKLLENDFPTLFFQ